MLLLSSFTRKPGCFTAANYRDLSRVISVSFRDVWDGAEEVIIVITRN